MRLKLTQISTYQIILYIYLYIYTQYTYIIFMDLHFILIVTINLKIQMFFILIPNLSFSYLSVIQCATDNFISNVQYVIYVIYLSFK